MISLMDWMTRRRRNATASKYLQAGNVVLKKTETSKLQVT